MNLLRLLLYLVDLLYQSYRLSLCLNANYSVIANRVSEDCIFQNEHCISKIEDCISQDEDCKSERRIAKFKKGLQTCCHELFLMVIFAFENLRLDFFVQAEAVLFSMIIHSQNLHITFSCGSR